MIFHWKSTRDSVQEEPKHISSMMAPKSTSSGLRAQGLKAQCDVPSAADVTSFWRGCNGDGHSAARRAPFLWLHPGARAFAPAEG